MDLITSQGSLHVEVTKQPANIEDYAYKCLYSTRNILITLILEIGKMSRTLLSNINSVQVAIILQRLFPLQNT